MSAGQRNAPQKNTKAFWNVIKVYNVSSKIIVLITSFLDIILQITAL